MLPMLHGKAVIGYDGEPVGVCMEGNDHAIRVRLLNGHEAWLRGDAILNASGPDVVLICYAEGIDRWVYAP